MGEFKAEVFKYPLQILEKHLDTFGHVNNATYLQILEEARWQIITERSFGLKVIQEKLQGPVVIGIEIKFIKELKLRQKIIIYSQAISYEGKIGKLKQWIENEEGKLCCEALFTIALFDTKLRKMLEPTSEWLHAIGVS